MDTGYISNHIKCTWEEKLLCIQTVKDLLTLGMTARCKGLLELEAAVQKREYQNIPLIRIGVDLIVDGTDPEIVKSVLENYMLSSTLTNKEFLDNILIYTALLAIQQGENPGSIKARLCSFFGIEFIEEFKNHMEQAESEENLQVLLAQNEERLAAFHKTDYLDKLAAVMDNNTIQRVLREVSLDVFENAVIGSKKSTIELFLKNLSKHNQLQFFSDLNYKNSIDKNIIERNQKEILTAIKKLKESGEILLYSRTDFRKLTKEEINGLLEKKQ